MKCNELNPFVAQDEKRRLIKCSRPAGHTRWHKGRGRIWDGDLSRWTFKKRRGNV